VLPGSQIARELTVENGSVEVYLDITEVDPVNDEHARINQDLSATDDSKPVEDTAEWARESYYAASPSCELTYRFYREVTLIVPLPSAGQEIVTKG
jgi:hypothetical protein